MARRSLCWFVALAASFAACSGEHGVDEDDDGEPVEGPDFPVRYRTRYVDLAPGFTQPVCRGTIDAIDRHVAHVAAQLDIDVQARPTVYWFNEHADGALAANVGSHEWCGDDSICTARNGEAMFTNLDSMPHELVHATVLPAWGSSTRLFEEGIAMAFDGRHRVLDPTERPSELAGGTRSGGAHFTRWLLERSGPAKLRALFGPHDRVPSTKEEVLARIEAVYGASLLELEAEYFATAPAIYPAVGLCEGLDHVPSQGSRWELVAAADCDAPRTFGPRDEDAGLELAVTLELPALDGVPFTSWVDPPALGRLTPCIEAPLDDVADPMAVVSDRGVGNGLVFDSPGGRYRLTLPLPASGEVRVRICPWNGRHPTAGEEDPDLCLDG